MRGAGTGDTAAFAKDVLCAVCLKHVVSLSAHIAPEGCIIVALAQVSSVGPPRGDGFFGVSGRMLKPYLPFPLPQPPVHLP